MKTIIPARISFAFLCIAALALPGLAQLRPLEQTTSEFEVNGLKVIVKRRPGAPTVSVGLFVRGGVAELTPKTAGIENLTLLVATEAGKKYPRETLRKELARLGSSISAGSSHDYSALSLSSTREGFDTTWDIFADAALNPAFDPGDLELVRSKVMTGLRNKSVSPDSALDTLEEQIVYAGHPYSVDPGGTLETVSGFSVADLVAHHRSIMNPSRLLLVAVGDVNVDDFRRKVADSFGKLPKRPYNQKSLPSLAFAKPSLDIQRRDLETDYVKGIFAAPAAGHPDYHAMHVAIAILQGRVYQEVRVKRNLSYAPNAEMGDMAANTANIYVTSTDANEAVGVMMREIETMRTAGVSDDEFTGIPGFFLTTYFIKQETNAAQVGELARYELIGGGWRNAGNFIRGVSSVKPSDVKRVAEKYMTNIKFVVVGKAQNLKREVFVGR